MTLKLYYAKRTRSARPRWLLEELEVPFELVHIDMAKKEHKQPEYLAIHPLGQVPALVDGETTMIQSGAICLHLADKFPDKGLAPAAGTVERGSYYQWVVFGAATLDSALMGVWRQHSLPEADRSATAVAEAKAKLEPIMKVVERALEGQTWLVGETFTAADVVIGALLLWGKMMNVTPPTLAGYCERLQTRPAWQRSQVQPSAAAQPVA